MTAPIVPPRVFWITAAGVRVHIPRGPIDAAGYAIPGPVTRPDGSVVFVMEDAP